jgi:uncharacterized protein YllA (UPF0747 family)
MLKMLMKLLGHPDLAQTLDRLRKEQEALRKSLTELQEKVEDIEVPDTDDFVQHTDLDDNIESYLSNNDYCQSDYIDDKVEREVADRIEEAINDLDLTEKVEEVVQDMDKASFGDTEEIRQEVEKAIRVIFKKALEDIDKKS